jgi:hypothetical protein
VYVHAKGEETFIISKMKIISIKSFVIDTRLETGITFAEFSVTSSEYKIVEFDGSNCKEYSSADKTVTDFDGFKGCVRGALHSYYSANLNCSVAGFVNLQNTATDNLKPECSNENSTGQSFEVMRNFTTTLSQNPDHFGCPKPCWSSDFKV